MTYKTHEITAFTEADLLQGVNGGSIGKGDCFTMPGSATTCISVTDNDAFLSGDNRRNENANDKTGQHASITDANGNEVGNGGQIYAEKYHKLKGSDGKIYFMIEIEQEGGNAPGAGDDYFTFYGQVPPAGISLTVIGGGNVRGNWVDFKCLSAGDKPAEPIDWTLDEDCTYTVEAEQFDLHNYDVVDGSNASGGELIKLSANDGRASTDFGGESGNYNIKISAQDETDGKSMIKVFVNGQHVGTINLDNQTDGGGSNNGYFSEFSLGDIQINEGDNVELRAWKDGGEFVRIDKIAFVQVKEPEFRECDDPNAVNIDFEGLVTGEVVNTQFDGVMISAQRDRDNTPANDAMIFDSANPTGGDTDLASDTQGNVLIVSEDNDSSDPDDAVGGTIWFKFDRPAFIHDIKVLDAEEGGKIRLLDSNGQLIQEIEIPRGADGGIQQVIIDTDGVMQIDLTLNGSGAIDDLCYTPGEPQPGSLSGRFFMDTNDDNQDDGEPAIAGVQVMLLDDTGAPTGDVTETDADGNYSFEGLAPGTYGVKFTDPGGVLDGKRLVDPNVGDDATDSDAIGDVDESVIEGIVVNEGENTPDNDAGAEVIPGAVSGRYFCDENRDGLDNDANNAVEGVTVELLDAAGGVVATTETDADGNYRFDDVAPGTYSVKFTDGVTGKELTAQNAGNDDAIDSDAADLGGGMSQIDGVVVEAGEENEDNDAGVIPPVAPGSLSGRFFMDTNDDNQDDGEPAIAGVQVMLLDDTGAPTGDVTETDADGNYSFEGLAPGTYGVKFTDPGGVLDGKRLVDPNVGDDATDSDAIGDVDESVIEGIVVNEGENTPDNDAGAEVIPGSLSGRFFIDANNDGQDNDPGNAVEGVLVELLDENGVPTGDTRLTDANGNYSFGNLAPGTYGVKFTDAVSGLSLIAPNQGGDDAIDSDAIDAGGNMSTIGGIVVNAGEDTPDNDAGVEELLGSISGRYFCDENGNAIDDGEDGVANREVTLTQAGADGLFGTDDDVIVATATTDENGEYSFDELAAGDYKVTINGANTLFDGAGNIIGGFVAANQGGDDTVDSDVNEMGMTDVLSLGTGEDLADVDAGTTKFVPNETGNLGIEGRLLASRDDAAVQFAFAFNELNEGGTTTYDADTDTLVTTGLVDQVSTTNIDLPANARTLIQLGVDENGDLVENGASDFLLFNDLDNDGQVGAGEEVFLEGEMQAFRAVDGFGNSSFYDGIVELTGGSLADMFDPLIGVSWASQFGEGSFVDFTQSFSEGAKGFFGDAGIDCFCLETANQNVIDDMD